jgi:hypothetical protein
LSIAAITTNYAVASKKRAIINQGWKKLSKGCLMINVDAAYDGIKGSASSGAVIRDSTGGFMLPHTVIYHIQ